MARKCFVCDKHTRSGNAVSHSQRKMRRQWLCNLQRVRILDDGVPRRTLVCAKCLKSGKVARAI